MENGPVRSPPDLMTRSLSRPVSRSLLSIFSRLRAGVFVGLALCLIDTAHAAPVEPFKVYVSTKGLDGHNGEHAVASAGNDGPVRTPARAQQLVRRLLDRMRESGTQAPIEVEFAPGVYRLTKSLQFTAADSGTEKAPVTWRASRSGTVTFSGATALRPAGAGGDDVARFEGPRLAPGEVRAGGQLFVNGRRAILAREPDLGADWFVAERAGDGPNGGKSAFRADAPNAAWLARLVAADRQRAIVNVMQSWTSSRHRLDKAQEDGLVHVSPAALWPFLQWGDSQRWFVENVEAAFDGEGEWLADDRGIRYRPRPQERAGKLAAEFPILERLVTLTGQSQEGGQVAHLRFEGLTFAYTRSALAAGGFLDWQAAAEVTAAVEVNEAHHIEFENCAFIGTGNWGLWLRRSVRESRVTGSRFADLGAGAIKIGETDRAPSPAATGHNTVRDNRIDTVGKVYPGAVALWIGQSFDNEVAGNLIRNTPYSGISVGWTWGVGPARSGGNRIEGNVLEDIGNGQMGDLGAIYTLGVSPGTVISSNVIRRVHAYPRFGGPVAYGIYLDQGSSDIRIENNTVQDSDDAMSVTRESRGNRIGTNFFGGAAARSAETGAAAALLRTLHPSAVSAQGLPTAAEPSSAIAAFPPATLAPPRPFALDLSHAEPGSQPVGLWYSAPPETHTIEVSEAPDAPGGRCLSLRDGPAQANPWDPHVYAPVHYDGGTASAEFQVRIDPDAVLVNQWRDEARPTLTGPSLQVSKDGLLVGGRKLAPIAAHRWYKLRATVPLGAGAGNWSLELTDMVSHDASVFHSLPLVSAGWKKLDWWGLMSSGTRTATLCVADIRLSIRPEGSTPTKRE